VQPRLRGVDEPAEQPQGAALSRLDCVEARRQPRYQGSEEQAEYEQRERPATAETETAENGADATYYLIEANFGFFLSVH
jgi:hypothetical protein